MSKVRALYDYEGNTSAEELSFKVNDIIDVANTETTDGWMQGRLRGKNGWFPANYVEILDAETPKRLSPADLLANLDTTPVLGSGATSSGKNKNTVKSPSDDFISESKPSNSDSLIKIRIGPGPRWVDEGQFSVSISDAEKKAKLGGMKEYISYRIITTKGGNVEHRYKHFDWLHERISEKFCALAFPLPPEKQMSGRFEDAFIERRRMLLERYMNRVVRHPVLRNSEVVQHFLKCVDEKDWKEGKRLAEKDAITGGRLYSLISVPPNNCPSDGAVEDVVQFGRFIKMFSRDAQETINAMEAFAKGSEYMDRQYDRLSFVTGLLAGSQSRRGDETVLNNVGSWDSRTGNTELKPLTEAIGKTATAFKTISQSWRAEHEKTVVPLAETVREYVSLLPSFAPIIDNHLSAAKKKKDSQKHNDQTTSEVYINIQEKTDVVINVTLAEINRFHDERREDFNAAFKQFLQSHIAHHQKIIDSLNEALQLFS